jgi:hypothetical protein
MADFFYRLPRSRQHIISLFILFAVPLILFFNTTLGGKEIDRHDIIQWRAGAESIIEYREQFGEEPLWASNMFGGMPSFVVSTKTQVPHLNNLAKFFNKIYPAFQYWVMLSGMYVFLILMGFRPLSAVFGSITFGLTTYFPVIIMAGHTSKFFTLAFVPWTFAGYWLLTRTDKRIAGLLVLTAAFALEVRAGHPQITYYFMYLMGIWWIYDSVQWFRNNEAKKFAVVTALLILGGIMGMFGNAERTLSQQSYAEYSIRGGSDLAGTTGLDSNYAFAWSQGITETLTLLVPNLFGGASPDYWGPKSVTSGPHYLGALAFFFMILGIWKTRDKLLYIFLGVGILAIFFSWGGNFITLNKFAFNYIPLFDKFRAPETWLVVTSFCFTVVAVYGLDELLNLIKEKPLPIKSFYKSIGTILTIFILVFVQVKSFDFIGTAEVDRIAAQIAQQNQLPASNPQVVQRAQSIVNQQLVPVREEKANSDLLRLGIFVVLGIGIVYAVSQNKVSPAIAGLSIILLTGIDMIQVGQRYMDERKFVTSNVDSERLILSERRDQDEYIKSRNESEDYPYRVFPLDISQGPFSNAIPSYFYPSLGGYSGAKLSLAQEVFMAPQSPLFGGEFGLNLGLLSALNTKYITYNSGIVIPGLTPVFTGANGGVVYENEQVLPKAYFVDSVISVDTPQEAYDLIFADQIDFYTSAVVENYQPTTAIDSLSNVSVASYTGAEMTFDISRTEPGFLVISEIFYPDGWIALLNGEEIPIYKTNYLLRGVEIPTGNHTLELDFRPSSFYNGVKLSWLSLIFQLGLAGFLVFGAVTDRKKSAE